MANVRNGNTFYIDTASSTLAEKNLTVTHITLTATSAGAILVLQDITTAAKKVDLRVATSGDTKVFRFDDNPLNFPNGINPATLTNAVATCHLRSTAR